MRGSVNLPTQLVVVYVLLGAGIRVARGYSTGAPTAACGDMTPGHGYPINTGAAPYLVEVSKTQYSPNERIYVRIRACGQGRFKGFMVQPRSAMFPDRPAFLGAFLRVRGTRHECVRSGAVLTHNSPVDKQSVTLTWIAPPGAAGHVVFRVTFVQSFTNYWVAINSPVIYDGVSRDLSMIQVFSLQSSTSQTCMSGAGATTPVNTTGATTPTTTPTTTTTTPSTTTATTTSPSTTTTRMTTTTTPTTTTTRPTTTTTTKATTTTTEPITTFVSLSSTDYWGDWWETTTANLLARETTPTSIPTATTTTSTTPPPTPTTTIKATTTTTKSTTTTTKPTTTTKATTTTTTTTKAPTTLPPTTTTTPRPTTITTTIPTTTRTTTVPTTTTTPHTTTTRQTTTTTPIPTTTTTTTLPTTAVPSTTEHIPDFTTESSFYDITFDLMETTTARRPITTYKAYPETTLPHTTTLFPDLTFPPMTLPPAGPPSTLRATTRSTRPTTTRRSTTTAATTTPRATTTTSTLPPPTTTEFLGDLPLTPDPDCGVTQGCFDDCKHGVCNFIVSWKTRRDSTEFEIRTKPTLEQPYWAAIGFSNDRKMGLDSVTECLAAGDGSIQVYQSYNLDYYRNIRLTNPKLGVSGEYGAVRNGIFHCSFTRANFVAGEKDVFDLTRDWHMMFAEGPAINGIKIPHRYDAIPPVTRHRIDLQTYPPTHVVYDPELEHRLDQRVKVDPEPPRVTQVQRRIAADEECGQSHSCFQDCTSLGCKFIVSWVSEPDNVTFTLKAMLNDTRNQWIAIAFSHDDKMGDDSVIQCVADELGDIRVSHSYNKGKNNIRLEDADVGLGNISTSFVDGVFKCSFVRDRHIGNTERIFNLDRQWNILFAHGRSKKGIMLPHSFADLPHVSDSRVDFTRLEPSLITASNLYIKIHAGLMIFAWVLCASLATVVGRYFQPFWWGEKRFGSKSWIKVHWLFVLLTCIAVVTGFVIIFLGVNGISRLYQNSNATFNDAHPVMGLIVTLLTLLHPLLLLLRPTEDSPTRAFFNCMYWIAEFGAHALAVITIYAGFGLASDLVPYYLAYVLVGFAIYHILVLLFMEGLKNYDAKKTIEKKKMYLYEMQIRPWNPRRNNSVVNYMQTSHSSQSLKRAILSTHFLVLMSLTAVLLLIISITN